MNLNILENMARIAAKGENLAERSGELLKKGVISPIEHKSLSSLSWQIAANVNGAGTMALTKEKSEPKANPWI